MAVLGEGQLREFAPVIFRQQSHCLCQPPRLFIIALDSLFRARRVLNALDFSDRTRPFVIALESFIA